MIYHKWIVTGSRKNLMLFLFLGLTISQWRPLMIMTSLVILNDALLPGAPQCALRQFFQHLLKLLVLSFIDTLQLLVVLVLQYKTAVGKYCVKGFRKSVYF